MSRERSSVDHRPADPRLRRDLHVPRWMLALLALAILSGVMLLFTWLERQDPGNRVVGRPAEFGSRPEEPAEARPFIELDIDVDGPPERPQVQAAQPILSLEAIAQAERPDDLRGRTVILDGVRVLRVVGNYTFWVGGEGDAPSLPVLLRGELMGRQPEGRVEVRAGQQVRILGTLRRLVDIAALG
ncbi:MAG TPA: hypothetical protein VLS89_09685, partial [Candidatus Nanopelagicales bacterium]|nr:hypothetical protein [Candidatus Nanopelagicales bacterium]